MQHSCSVQGHYLKLTVHFYFKKKQYRWYLKFLNSIKNIIYLGINLTKNIKYIETNVKHWLKK